ncbi:MAG: beta-L-arabinofuranosidase domain-containing protein [Luteolibacter sp.]
MRGDLHAGFVGRFDRITPTASAGLFGGKKADYQGPLPPGARVTWWSGEVEAHWMDALIRMAFLAGDAEYQDVAKRWVRDIIRNLGEDGYIGIYKPEIRLNHDRENGELWTMSRAMLAMLAYADFTGDAECLAAVRKGVDLVMSRYDEDHSYFKPGRIGGLTHGLTFVDVLEALYRLSGDKRYVRFAGFLYDDYNRHARLNRDIALDSLLDPNGMFLGHGAHIAEQFMIPFFLADTTGRDDYRTAAANALAKFRFHHAPGGSINSVEAVRGKEGSADCLREYCTFKSFTLSLTRAAMITGRGEPLDWVERIVYNAAQGARFHPALEAVEYCSSDNRVSIDPDSHGGRLMYSACHGAAPCCAVSAAQLLPNFVESLWMRRGKDELVAMQYGPCVVNAAMNGTPVQVTATTDYPFSDDLLLEVAPQAEAEFTLALRRPGHVEEVEIVGNAGAVVSRDGDFVKLRKKWNRGDAVRVRFACRVQNVAQPPSETVQGKAGGIYLQRGPLVYALPFPHEFRVLQELGDSGFKNYAVHTVDNTGWDDLIDPEIPFEIERVPGGDAGHPWQNPPLRLKGRLVDSRGRQVPVLLVPLGSTVLRRVTFPVAADHSRSPDGASPRQDGERRRASDSTSTGSAGRG